MHAVDYVVGGEKNHEAFSDDFAGASQSPAEVTKECQLGSLMEIIILGGNTCGFVLLLSGQEGNGKDCDPKIKTIRIRGQESRPFHLCC